MISKMTKTDFRTIEYESFKNETKKFIEQQLTVNGWTMVNYMAVPIVMFDNIRFTDMKKKIVETAKHWKSRRFNSGKLSFQW